MCCCFIFPFYGNLLLSYLQLNETYWELDTYTQHVDWSMDFSPSPYISTVTVGQGRQWTRLEETTTFKIDYNREDEYIITTLVHI